MLETLTMARLCGWSGSVIAVLLYGIVAVAQSSPCGASSNVREVRGDLNIMSRCELNGTDVRGDVVLFSGGSLIARNVEISGDLEANRADFVDIADSVIDGEVELNELVGDRSIIAGSTIDGSIFLTANRSVLEILNNEVGDNIRAIGNTGGLTISGNSVEGRLECCLN